MERHLRYTSRVRLPPVQCSLTPSRAVDGSSAVKMNASAVRPTTDHSATCMPSALPNCRIELTVPDAEPLSWSSTLDSTRSKNGIMKRTMPMPLSAVGLASCQIVGVSLLVDGLADQERRAGGDAER